MAALTFTDSQHADHLAIEPFAAPARALRRRVVGVDVWLTLRQPGTAALPRMIDAARDAGLRLEAVARTWSERVWPGPADRIEAGAELRCRFLVRNASWHLTDEGITELLPALAAVGTWTVVHKLEEFDGFAAYGALAAAID